MAYDDETGFDGLVGSRIKSWNCKSRDEVLTIETDRDTWIFKVDGD